MSELTPLQQKLLALLKAFHTVCETNKLTYYVAFGTMLGCVRHGGFIPWDDDIDVTMPRKDYEKLKQIMKKPSDDYSFETSDMGHKDFGYAFGKFYDNHTTLIETSSLKTKRGIYLDVFPLDDAGNTYKEAEKLYRKVYLSRVLLQSRLFPIKKGRGIFKNSVSLAARLIPFYRPNKAAAKLERKEALNTGKNALKAVFSGTEDFTHCVLENAVYGKPALYQFENIQVYGPEQGEKYLEKVFGDWKTLPPEEKRVIRHDFIKLELDSSYLEDK